MRLKILLVVLLAALCVTPALAQDSATFAVAFDGFSFNLPSAVASNVNISQYPGDPTTLQQPGGPEVKHTQFLLYNGSPAPESFLDGAGGIRIYNTADFAGYDLTAGIYQSLQSLLAQRPDLGQYMTANQGTNAGDLPYLPIFPAAQVIRARAHYIDTPFLQGVGYVTAYRQDVSPFVGSEFLYTVQGLSSDGAHYVSATFKLNTALFPAEVPQNFDYNTFNQQFEQYLSQSIATLNNATPQDFTPSLTVLDTFVQSFAFTGAGAPTTPATVPPQPTPTLSDTAMGGLAGVTWTLISYGDSGNPQLALAGTPVTLTFSSGGVSGNAGCNSYGGSFQYDGNTITINQVIRTLMACDQPIMRSGERFPRRAHLRQHVPDRRQPVADHLRRRRPDLRRVVSAASPNPLSSQTQRLVI